MAVQTLDQVVRSRNSSRHVVRKPAAAIRRPVLVTLENARRQATLEAAVKVSKLEEVEDRLLADALDRHENIDVVLDHVLDDVDGSVEAELERSRRRPLLLRSTTSLNRVEDLLLEAVLRKHPNAERAFDRLLDDVAGDDNDAPTTPADFIDNDFDGLG